MENQSKTRDPYIPALSEECVHDYIAGDYRVWYARSDCPDEWRGLTGMGGTRVDAYADFCRRVRALSPEHERAFVERFRTYRLDPVTKQVEQVFTLEEWKKAINPQTIARTVLAECDVSTIFLGTDHNFTQKGPPLLFETLVFGGPLDQQQERYSTYDEAIEGHARLVARAKAWAEP